MTPFTESDVESAALEWLGALGWTIAHGPDIGPHSEGAERADYTEVVLEHRLRDALVRLNADLPSEALDDAFRKLSRPEGSTLEARNRTFHRMLVDGVTVEYRTAGGAVRGAQVSILDYDNPANNDWLAVNQFTVVEGEHERRPDIVLFVNGLPLGLLELKNPADEQATVWTAWNQIRTYKAELTDLFAFNAVLIASDGVKARAGTLTAGREWFKPWRTITGEALADPSLPQLRVMLEGMCNPHRFLGLVRDFIVFEDDGGGRLAKKMAGYHQFHAVETAVGQTLRAAALWQEARKVAEPDAEYDIGYPTGGDPGDRRIGVVWHTQGSGKSLTMAFYAGRIAREPKMENPTIVVLTDRNDLDDQLFGTRAVFGDYISVYDIGRAVEDKATVPIYYESRLARLALDEAERPKIDPDFEEATEGEEVERKERLKTKWAQLEAVVGAPHRLELIAQDIVAHFDRRLEAIDGKAMIVCMSRRICVDLYRELIRLRSKWHHEDDADGEIKVVMTGSASDPPDWQPLIRNKKRRELLAKRFRDPRDPLRVVLVRDMWLTGFDAPSLHTMYVDKPMRGHGLMQAIARVNRVFRDKPGGLVVDYLGLAHELKRALATYTESGGTGKTTVDQSEAVTVMLEKYEVCRGLFHGFNYSAWTRGTPAERTSLLPAAQEHILAQENGKERCLLAVRELSQAFALAVPHEAAIRIRDDMAFFQAVRSVLAKRAAGEARTEEDLDMAIRQIVSRAVASEGVVDIFAAAGLEKPDISILSEEFLAEVRGMKRRNLAVELLRKLLKGELAVRRRRNVVQARSFAEMLDQTVRRYANRAIEAAQVIEELIQLAREMREANARGEALGLTEDELAFYDALETNDSAVRVLGDETLRDIARELVETVRNNVRIDWTLRENVRANLRRLVKRILRKHGYPPDKQEKATRTVLEQAEVLSEGWAA